MSKNPWRIAKACRLQVLAKGENRRNWPEAGKSREAFWRLALRRRGRTSTTCHEENRRPGTAGYLTVFRCFFSNRPRTSYPDFVARDFAATGHSSTPIHAGPPIRFPMSECLLDKR